jgi:hypothetical protein
VRAPGRHQRRHGHHRNLTVTGSNANSFLTVHPTGAAATTSNLNFAVGQTVPNLVAVRLGTAGSLTFTNAVGATHVILDVSGYYAPT